MKVIHQPVTPILSYEDRSNESHEKQVTQPRSSAPLTPEHSRLRSAKKNLAAKLPKSSSQPETTAATNSRRPQPKRLNGRRVASNSMLTGVSTALSFGLLASVNNIARQHPNPMVKMAGAHAPVIAGVASAYIAHGIQNAFDIISSASSKASIVYDAISPAFIMGTNYAYALSKLPKFPAATPAGVAATMLVTATGAAIGGAMTELAAQTWPGAQKPAKPGATQPPSTRQSAIGRGITQLPAVQLNKKIAKIAAKASAAAIPKPLLLAAPAATAVPFMFRRLVTPAGTKPATVVAKAEPPAKS